MADEVVEEEGSKKSPLVKIIILAVVGLVVLAGAVLGTLFAVGFFDKKDAHAAEEQLKKLEEEGIGRPSTYAATIGTIERRGYIFRQGKALVPSQLLDENYVRAGDILEVQPVLVAG